MHISKNHQPRVSVLMPLYNAENTLEESLHSVLSQSLQDIEVVAVDDGSQDGSAVILRDWMQRDPRVRPVFAEHVGIVEAPNIGLHMCRGEFIARMDADDRMHRYRLQRQIEYFESNPSLSVVSCLVEIFAEDGVGEGMRIYQDWLNALVTHADIAREIFIESPIANPTAMMRRSELIALGGYWERGWPEDYDLWLRYHRAGKLFAKVPEVLLYWREHAQRATHIQSRYSVESFLRVKAHYLIDGPLQGHDGLLVWGAGKTGRRLAKHLQRGGAALDAFIDITPKKIGGMLRGTPVIGPEAFVEWWRRFSRPVLLTAVASRGARALIRAQLEEWGLEEGVDYWCAA